MRLLRRRRVHLVSSRLGTDSAMPVRALEGSQANLGPAAQRRTSMPIGLRR